MLSDALPSARNPQRFHRSSLLQFVSLTSLLLCFALLNGCSVASSAPVPANSAAKPLTAPGTNPGTRSLTLSANLLPGEVGVSYNGTLSVSGGTAPYQFSVSWGQLPTGLVLGATTGTVSGVPGAKGTFNFGIHVTDSKGLGGAQKFQLTISDASGVVVTVTPATAAVQSAGTAQFTALVSNTSNVAVTWKASPGTISSAGLYQAPTVSVTTPATLTATSVADPTKSATASVTITSISAPPLAITTTSLSGATAGTSYSNPLSATGGKSPYTWTLTSGALPAGITLQSTGS